MQAGRLSNEAKRLEDPSGPYEASVSEKAERTEKRAAIEKCVIHTS